MLRSILCVKTPLKLPSNFKYKALFGYRFLASSLKPFALKSSWFKLTMQCLKLIMWLHLWWGDVGWQPILVINPCAHYSKLTKVPMLFCLQCVIDGSNATNLNIVIIQVIFNNGVKQHFDVIFRKLLSFGVNGIDFFRFSHRCYHPNSSLICFVHYSCP